MMRVKHWQDAVNAVLGAWLILAPWAMSIQDHTVATATLAITGGLLLAVAVGALVVPRAWEEWVEGAIGLWLIASPWVMRFSDLRGAMANAVIVGLAALVLALWTLATDKEYGGWWSRHAA